MTLKGVLRKLDMFRKVPTELTEGSTCGSILTLVCYISVAVLITFEFHNYLTPETKSDYFIEQHRDEFIRINFNITMLKLSCEYASLDVVNQMGTHKINITQNIRRFQVYENGYSREITPVELDSTYGLEENMKVEKISRLLVGMDDFLEATSNHKISFVNFFAPWCHWCQALAPIYEGVALRIKQNMMDEDILVAKVDCTNRKNIEVCRKNMIQAYPTMILYSPKGDIKFMHYHGVRTVDAIMEFLTEAFGAVNDGVTNKLPLLNLTASQEGCRLEGSIVVPRMSGNFHISCHGSQSYILASEINVSHQVHSLTFGDQLKPYELNMVPEYIQKGMNVLQEKKYTVFTTNTSYEHILKVFPTQIHRKNEIVDLYQFTSDSGMGRSDEDYPEATFSFDFNPMTIVISEVRKPFYHFITSLFAIIGGVVTIISLLDSIFNRAEMIYREKENLGKAE